MKKYLQAFIPFIAITLTSCNGLMNSPNDKDLKDYDRDVKSIIITNPTMNQQGKDESWVSIKTKSRNAAEEEVWGEEEDDFESETEDLNNSREATKEIEYTIGESFTFEDEYVGTRPGKMRYEGQYCYLWTLNDENEKSAMTDEELKTFADAFDTIYIKETALIGPKYQGESKISGIITNPDKKISILLCDIKNDKNQGSWLGYFYSIHYDRRYGNGLEMITIDSYFAKDKNYKIATYSTLAHEFNHLLNYCNKTLKYGKWCDSWYTEMLSMLVEDFFMDDLGIDYTGSPHHRLETFVNGSYTYGFGAWDNDDPKVGKCYANAYAFGAYLARNYGGAKLVHEIATNEYVNEESVVKAVNKINGTSYTFEDLFKGFPEILINTENKKAEFSSLYKATSDELTEVPGYTYKLNPINLANLAEGVKIQPNELSSLKDDKLNPFGFLFYDFDKPTNVKVDLEKDFLTYEAYN